MLLYSNVLFYSHASFLGSPSVSPYESPSCLHSKCSISVDFTMSEVMEPIGILVGDELGQLKKIDLVRKDYTTFNVTPEEAIHPTKSIVSISPLHTGLVNNYYLIATRRNELFIFDSNTDQIQSLALEVANTSPIIGCSYVDDQSVAVAFKNGGLYSVNIEKDLCAIKYNPNLKATSLLGIENVEPKLENNQQQQSQQPNLKPSKLANQKNPVVKLYEPNWNLDTNHLTTLKVCNKKVAVGGFNCDLKVFDVLTGQVTFAAKSTNTDWLGLRHDIWLSDLAWMANDGEVSHLIATCSRNDPYVKIYDIRENQRKAMMSIDFKPVNNANLESNPPSLTSICSLPDFNFGNNSSYSLVVGTTLGRMLAVDVRSKLRTSKVIGGFKGFNGGSIRDIKAVRNDRMSYQLFSCSLDRFVRLHQLTKTSRIMNKKIYIKTRPTCLCPIAAPTVNKDQEKEDDEDSNVANDEPEETGPFDDDDFY